MITIYAQLFEREFAKSMAFEEMVIYLKDPKSVFWIDLQAPTEDEIHMVQDVFAFHPLCIEDCMSYSNLPKIDEFDEYVFAVMHEPLIHGTSRQFDRPEIDFFLGKNFLISVHHHQSPAVQKNMSRCQSELLYHQALKYEKGATKTAIKDNTMFKNSDFVLHSILDSIVDSYFPMIDTWDETIAEIEDRVLSAKPERSVLNEILTVKRQISVFRRILSPQRDVISRLIHSDNKAISKSSQIYFRDVYDHLIRANEMLDFQRDTMSNVLDAYYSVLSHQINEYSHRVNLIMQRLTIITTIFMPLTFIAGVYGMNFQNMPELKWEDGYYFALALMSAVALVMYYFFRRKDWF